MRTRLILSITIAALVALSVPASAAVVDLTTAGSSGSINDAIFDQFSGSHGAGTGNFGTFLVIQASPTEQGFNTDGSPLPLDDKEPAHTNALLLSDVPIVDRGGILYREFGLDIDQRADGNNSFLSLDRFLIALNTAPDLTDMAVAFANPIYDLDTGADNWIKLDGSLSSGGGQGDMLALIPNAFFVNPAGPYVYVYSQFGENNAANSGPEEWGVMTATPIPAPVALWLAGVGIAVARPLRRTHRL